MTQIICTLKAMRGVKNSMGMYFQDFLKCSIIESVYTMLTEAANTGEVAMVPVSCTGQAQLEIFAQFL